MTVVTCVVADPPWHFADALPGKTRGAARKYPCMTVEQIAALNPMPPECSPNSVLFLWRVAAMQEEALRVIRAWGYTLKSELVWRKLTKTGKPFFGMGRYTRGSHETCLLAVRGRAPVAVRNVRSEFAAKVREHSRKPEEFYQIVEALYPHAMRFELFSRSPRRGWIQWGLESRKFVPAPQSTASGKTRAA
jgi:N6-adenosine-specific RNA methylase IME4